MGSGGRCEEQRFVLPENSATAETFNFLGLEGFRVRQAGSRFFGSQAVDQKTNLPFEP